MKKVLQIAGIIFLVLVVVIAGAIGYAAYQGNKLDKSAENYVDESVKSIVKDWNQEELYSRASPEFLISSPRNQVDLIFGKLKNLGAMEEFQKSKGTTLMNYDTNKGKVISGAYKASAIFKNGNATFDVKIVQNNGVWEINSFRVESPIFKN